VHADAFDRYEARASLIHRLDARTKILATAAFILSNVLLPDGAWLGFGLSWLVILSANLWSQLGPTYTLRRSFVALPFVLPALTMVFTLRGQPVWEGQLGPLALVATDAGLIRFTSIVVRSWLSVQMGILLVTTTTFPDVARGLQRLHAPGLIVAIMGLLYRYLFVLADEVVRLLRARDARSAHLPGAPRPSVWWRAQVAGHLAGQLFLRSYERSDRVYQAMLARGFQGRMLTLDTAVMQRADWLLIAAGTLLLAGIHLAVR
jgi:cobalt/nickel transport system permease protein